MKTPKTLIAVVLTITVLFSQVGIALAAPASKKADISGTVQNITIETDANTGVTTVLVTILDDNNSTQTVRLSTDVALTLDLITIDANGIPIPNPDALGTTIQINPATVLQDKQNPVGAALSNFFGDITDYDTIMAAHANGVGFGIIAQALWITMKLDGDADVFQAIILAKEDGDYSVFFPEGETAPTNWGQFRKALLDGKGNLGTVMSSQHNNNGNHSNNGQNNGNGQDNGNHGNGQNNGNNGNHGNGNNGNGNN